MIVSYSTDQVYASRDGNDLSRHQVAFPDGEGYANPEGVGILDGTDRRALGEAFIDFLLSPEAQANVARLNVQFPATTNADLDEEFDRYAHEPDEIVSFSYEELYDDLGTWVDDWAREIAGR